MRLLDEMDEEIRSAEPLALAGVGEAGLVGGVMVWSGEADLSGVFM